MIKEIKMRKVLVVIIISIIGFVVVTAGFSSKNDQEFALANAERILTTMSEGQRLPWTSEDDNLYAVLSCPDGKIFVRGSRLQPAGIFLSCSYSMAEDIEILPSTTIFSREGKFVFKPIPGGGAD